MQAHPIRTLLLLTTLLGPGSADAQTSLDAYFRDGNNRTPLICGHRGGSGADLPENSLARFTALADAFAPQAVMIELDVRKSADGELYVLHDGTLDRTTTGTDSLHRVGSAYLQQLHLTTGDGAVTTEKIPTFRAVLTWLAGRDNVFLMVDVKGDCWREVTAMIGARQLTDRCLLLTFSPAVTRQAYDLLPDAWVSALVSNAAAYDRIRALNLPTGRRVAYVTDGTPRGVRKQLQRDGFVLTTDVSELRKGHPAALPRRFYRAFARKHKLGVLITDFPVGVGSLM